MRVMDIFAHFLWTFAMYWKHPKRWIAGIIGFMPDILSFGVLTVVMILTRTPMVHGARGMQSIPSYVYTLYSITHSLVTFSVVAIILWFAARDWFWLIGGWLLHILIDIPSHTAGFFPTPILWPFSDFVLSGVSWGTTWFMIANYSAIILVYTWLIWKVKGPERNAHK